MGAVLCMVQNLGCGCRGKGCKGHERALGQGGGRKEGGKMSVSCPSVSGLCQP